MDTRAKAQKRREKMKIKKEEPANKPRGGGGFSFSPFLLSVTASLRETPSS
jgi:hypothetical protein